MRFLLILFSFLISGVSAFCQEDLLSGLYFSSHEVIQDKRTSLNLTPEGPNKFPDGFSLEMEANFRQGDGHYGYIFRLIGDGHTNIDLVSNLAITSSNNFWLVLKDKVLFSFKWSDVPNGDFNRWIKIRIDIDIRNKKVAISFNGNKQEATVSNIDGLRNFEMVFGACRKTLFFNKDVSPMSLKNIRIFDTKKNLVRDWKLSKHGQNVVYDEVSRSKALVENPIWSIDRHVKWRKLMDLKLDSIQGITRDEETGRIFFVDTHSVYILSTETSAMVTIPFAKGSPYFAFGRQIIFNKFTNELWSYSFDKSEINKFSFVTNAWSFDEMGTNEPDLWHHNKFISPTDSSLVTLFGYGHYLYKSRINQYDVKEKRWKQINRIEQIQPRYLSSIGFLNNREMLVFGGYGSKTGRQELSPEFYYDLHSLNLSDYSFKKLWTLNTPSEPFVPCESLISDQQNGCFYSLVYNNGNYSTFLHLAKFGIEKNECQFFNDSIPYNFLDTKSWSTLFLDKKTSQLIAVTTHNSDASLYVMAYPPLMPEDVYQSVSFGGSWYVWFLVILLLVGLIPITFLLIRSRKRRNKKERLYELVDHPNIAAIEPIDRKTVSSIYFMGGFQIYDSKGRNITTAFSPTLKHLFLFIFLHTIKNEKGVSSAKLDEVLWFDKSGDSARNNRNVNISKLRSILDELGGVEVVNENSFWKIKMGPNISCDFREALQLLRKTNSTNLSEIEIKQLIALLSFGEFLPAVQTDWMDEFKSKFANEAIDGLSSLFKLKEVWSNVSLRYHLAECILVYDPLNDEAFAVKCSVLYHLGKKGMAKNLYDSFSRDYKKALGIDYAIAFNDTVN